MPGIAIFAVPHARVWATGLLRAVRYGVLVWCNHLLCDIVYVCPWYRKRRGSVLLVSGVAVARLVVGGLSPPSAVGQGWYGLALVACRPTGLLWGPSVCPCPAAVVCPVTLWSRCMGCMLVRFPGVGASTGVVGDSLRTFILVFSVCLWSGRVTALLTLYHWRRLASCSLRLNVRYVAHPCASPSRAMLGRMGNS